MAEVEIVRTQVIVVKQVWEAEKNGYSYFLWTDEKDKEYKVPEKRKQYFEEIIVPNAAVQLNYAVYKGKEYVYSAESVNDKLPTSTPRDAKIEAFKEEQNRKGDPRPSHDPQRKSIERQTALKSAVELAKGVEGATMATVIMDAQLAEYYLETGTLKGQPKVGSIRLVEEAMKLGATEVDDTIPF